MWPPKGMRPREGQPIMSAPMPLTKTAQRPRELDAVRDSHVSDRHAEEPH